jgi:hypothetical protein
MPKKQKYMSKIVLGQRYTDKIHSVSGVASSVTFFKNGCEKVILETYSQTQEKMVFHDFDVVDVVEENAKEIA